MAELELPTPLVSVEWLERHLTHPNLVVLNATLPKVGHPMPERVREIGIPGTRLFDLQHQFVNAAAELPNTMPSANQFEEACKELGVDNQSRVVIYDFHGVYSSPRAWWMFHAMGHSMVAVLDGGFPAWQSAGLPCVLPEAAPAPTHFVANPQPDLIANADDVLACVDDTNSLILDARAAGRFSGTTPEPRDDLRSGHIPSSRNLPVDRIQADGKLLPVAELQEIYRELDADGKRLVFSCGSGITACIIALSAQVAGHDRMSVYDGSWAEWGAREDLPIES